MAALDDGVLPLQLAERSLHHLVGHGIGKKDHQIGIPQFVPKSAGGLREDLRLTLIALAKVLIATFHTFVAAQNHNTHKLVLSV